MPVAADSCAVRIGPALKASRIRTRVGSLRRFAVAAVSIMLAKILTLAYVVNEIISDRPGRVSPVRGAGILVPWTYREPRRPLPRYERRWWSMTSRLTTGRWAGQ
jgi:hypothetical protein